MFTASQASAKGGGSSRNQDVDDSDDDVSDDDDDDDDGSEDDVNENGKRVWGKDKRLKKKKKLVEHEPLNADDDLGRVDSAVELETDNLIVGRFSRIFMENNTVLKMLLQPCVLKVNGAEFVFKSLKGFIDW